MSYYRDNDCQSWYKELWTKNMEERIQVEKGPDYFIQCESEPEPVSVLQQASNAFSLQAKIVILILNLTIFI